MKQQIYSADITINVTIPPEHMDAVHEALNKFHVGVKNVNIVAKNGEIVPNPLLESKPEMVTLKDANWRVFAGQNLSMTLTVYSDGTRTLTPRDTNVQ